MKRVSRRVRANRENARRSTGPKTSAGKKRSSQNALKHGLARPLSASPQLAIRVAELAEALAGPQASDGRREVAYDLAEARVDVERGRIAHETILQHHASENGGHKCAAMAASENEAMPAFLVSATAVERLTNLLKEVRPLLRYEVRARSREKKAICALEAADLLK
ncbi:MAG: hypothetical protein NVS2B5_20450 [Beijerinckiaceae bacterium]